MFSVLIDANNIVCIIQLVGKNSSKFYPTKSKEDFDDVEKRKCYKPGLANRWFNKYIIEVIYIFLCRETDKICVEKENLYGYN